MPSGGMDYGVGILAMNTHTFIHTMYVLSPHAADLNVTSVCAAVHQLFIGTSCTF